MMQKMTVASAVAALGLAANPVESAGMYYNRRNPKLGNCIRVGDQVSVDAGSKYVDGKIVWVLPKPGRRSRIVVEAAGEKKLGNAYRWSTTAEQSSGCVRWGHYKSLTVERNDGYTEWKPLGKWLKKRSVPVYEKVVSNTAQKECIKVGTEVEVYQMSKNTWWRAHVSEMDISGVSPIVEVQASTGPYKKSLFVSVSDRQCLSWEDVKEGHTGSRDFSLEFLRAPAIKRASKEELIEHYKKEARRFESAADKEGSKACIGADMCFQVGQQTRSYRKTQHSYQLKVINLLKEKLHDLETRTTLNGTQTFQSIEATKKELKNYLREVQWFDDDSKSAKEEIAQAKKEIEKYSQSEKEMAELKAQKEKERKLQEQQRLREEEQKQAEEKKAEMKAQQEKLRLQKEQKQRQKEALEKQLKLKLQKEQKQREKEEQKKAEQKKAQQEKIYKKYEAGLEVIKEVLEEEEDEEELKVKIQKAHELLSAATSKVSKLTKNSEVKYGQFAPGSLEEYAYIMNGKTL